MKITEQDGTYTVTVGDERSFPMQLDRLGGCGYLLWRGVRKAQTMGVGDVPLVCLGMALARLDVADALKLSETMIRAALDATSNSLDAGEDRYELAFPSAAAPLPFGCDGAELAPVVVKIAE